jgi:hypothetical protein
VCDRWHCCSSDLNCFNVKENEKETVRGIVIEWIRKRNNKGICEKWVKEKKWKGIKKLKKGCKVWRYERYCDVHAVACFRGNKGGCLSNDYWMFPRNPFQGVFSTVRPKVIYSGQVVSWVGPLRGPQYWIRGMAPPRYPSYPMPGGIAGPPTLRGL